MARNAETSSPQAPISGAREWLTSAAVVAGLFSFAMVVRWWDLSSQTNEMFGDEARFMYEARRFIQGVYTSPFIVDWFALPGLYDYLLSFPLRIAGRIDVTVARGFTGAIAALGAPLIYFVARELGYPRRVGIVAGVVFATTFWSVLFSRMVLPNIVPTTTASATLLLVAMAVRRSNLMLAALAGVGLAVTLNAHLSGAMVVPVVFGWLGLLVLWHGDWYPNLSRRLFRRPSDASGDGVQTARRTIRFFRSDRASRLDLNSAEARPWSAGVLGMMAIIAAIAIVCLWPMLKLYFAPDSHLAHHMTEHNILNAENRVTFAAAHKDIGSSVPGLLWYQFIVTVDMFSVQGDPDAVFNVPGRPLLDEVSGLLLFAGVAGSVLRIRRPNASLVLLWFTIPFLFGVTLSTGRWYVTEVPTFTRALPALPALCLLVAVGLEYTLAANWVVLQKLVRWSTVPAWSTTLRLSIMMLVTCYIAVVELQRYWDYASSPLHKDIFYSAAREWSIFLGQRGPTQVTVISKQYWAVEYSDLYAPKARICIGQWTNFWGHCPTPHIIIFDSDKADADRYAAATHLRVHAGPSDDSVTRFWYVDGHALPDPAPLLHATPGGPVNNLKPPVEPRKP